MKLLAFDGSLRLKDCCATPANKVREADLAEVRRWAEERGYELRRLDRDPA